MTEYTAPLPRWRPALALYQLLARYPMRVTFPIIIGAGFALLMIDTYVHEVQTNRRHALEQMTSRVVSGSRELAAQLSHGLLGQHEGDIEAAFEALRQDADLDAAVLVDADGKVLAAHNAQAAGGAFEPVPFGLIETMAPGAVSKVHGARLYSVVPVLAHAVDGQPAREIARLYRRDDTSTSLRAASALARSEALRHGLEIGGVLLLMWWLGDRVHRARLTTIENAARAVTAGDFGVRISLTGNDELAQLARAFNDMLGRIEVERGKVIEQSQALAVTNAELDSLRNALDAHAIVSVTDEFGDIVHANDKFCEISGYTREELLGQNHRLLKSGVHGEETYRQLWNSILDGHAWHGVLQNRRKDGTPYWVQSSILPLAGNGARHGGFISLRTDITERERLRLALDRLARTDIREDPFDTFAEALAYGIDATVAGVVRFVENNQRQRLLGSWPRRDDPVESEVLGSAAAIRDGAPGFSQCSCLASLFPDDPLLIGHDCECLFAEPIVNLAGDPIGMLYALRRCRPSDEASTRALLGTVARRAAAEIQRQSMERAQARQQQWLEFVVNGAAAGVWDWDLTTDAVQYNENWAGMLGYTLAELTPHVETWKRFIHPDDAEFAIAAVAAHIAGGTPHYESEHRLRTREGDYIWVLDRGTVTARAPDGRPLRMSGVHIDITHLKRAQAALQAEQQRMQLVLDNVPIGLWELDLTSDEVRTSSQWLARLGIANADQPQSRRAWAKIIHPDDHEHVRQAFGAYLRGEAPSYLVDFRIAVPDGGWHWVMSRGVVSGRDESGRPLRMTGVHVDMQDQRDAEDHLRESEAQLQLVIQAGNLGVWDWQIDRDDFTHNSHMASMLGYDADELPSHAAWLALIHPEDDHASRVAMIAHLAGRTSFFDSEIRLRTRGGEWKWVATRGQVVERGANGRVLRMIGIHIDINDRKLAEAALVNSEARLRAVLDNSPSGIFWTDDKGSLQYLNASLRKNFGLAPDQGMGDTWLEFVHVDDQQRVRSTWRAFVTGDAQAYDIEYRYTLPTIGVRVVHVRVARTFGTGDALGFVGTLEDITEARAQEAEHERLRLQIQQAQKMEAVGQLAGGIAHDFNNILASVIGFGTLARQRYAQDPGSKLAEYLDAVLTAGERGREVVAKMLAFSRAAPSGQAQAIEPVAVAREVTHLLSTIIPSSIEFKLAVPDNVPPIAIDAVELHQVLVNLVVNARDAVDSHGHIVIRIDDVATYHDRCTACQANVDGEFVAISVSDDGAGMDAATLTRIFDPFYTTKEVGKGSGMGLSVVHGIMHRADGHILVRSTPGAGTEFVLLFRPAHAVPKSHAIDAQRAAPVDGLRVLVVDDEPLVRNFVSELLLGEGAQPTLAANGLEARTLFAARPQDFDVVFTDQTMPGLTGLELTSALRKVRADVPVVLYSGYTDAATREVARAGGVVFLGKPAEPQAVLQALESASRRAAG
ncbi:MAG: PAS domain-containing protein [Proteobacteria bacterium]|nr:PAS domain-containing protein [Pseudomonadota bacterium]